MAERKYIILNYIFAAFLIIITLIASFTMSYAIFTLIPLSFIVIFKKTRYYQFFTFIGGILIISVIALAIMGEMKTRTELISGVVLIVCSAIFILFGIRMPEHLSETEAGKNEQN